MVTRSSVWVSGLAGIGCIAVGAVLGALVLRHTPEPVASQEPLRLAVVPSFASVVERIGDGVVTVCALRDREGEAAPCSENVASGGAAVEASPTARRNTRAGMRSGSGFIASSRGLVVTSRHVVLGAFDIEVIVPGRSPFRAELVGEDAATDLALLRLVHAPADLQALPLAGENDLAVGDWIVAVGNPLGFAQTVTAGIVSFVGRHLRHSDFAVTNDFLQISAPVNPGNSGCPVVDLQGRVVGVTTQAPVEAQGISFAVPSRTVAWTLAAMQRAEDGRVRRGYLGIEFKGRIPVEGKGPQPAGAVITQVMQGQPGERAGLRSGDIVVGCDGTPLVDAKELHDRILGAAPGTPLALLVWRNGRADAPESLLAVLGELGQRPDSSND